MAPRLAGRVVMLVVFGCLVVTVAAAYGTGAGQIPVTARDAAAGAEPQSSDHAVFEQNLSGPHFTVYFHTGDDADAQAVLSLLEGRAAPRIEEDLGLEPAGIPVYIATVSEEYARISGIPEEIHQQGDAGAGSVNYGTLYLYIPKGTTISCPQEPRALHYGAKSAVLTLFEPGTGYCSCINTKAIVWGATYATLRRNFGPGGQILPEFFWYGLAHYEEYRTVAGPDFYPFDYAIGSNLLESSVQTGEPALMTLDQLSRRCGGSDPTLDSLCQGEGTYAVWYLNERYGKDAARRFLADLGRTRDWQASLRNVTGKDTPELSREILESLRLIADHEHLRYFNNLLTGGR